MAAPGATGSRFASWVFERAKGRVREVETLEPRLCGFPMSKIIARLISTNGQ
jgi:hypothetical protein